MPACSGRGLPLPCAKPTPSCQAWKEAGRDSLALPLSSLRAKRSKPGEPPQPSTSSQRATSPFTRKWLPLDASQKLWALHLGPLPTWLAWTQLSCPGCQQQYLLHICGKPTSLAPQVHTWSSFLSAHPAPRRREQRLTLVIPKGKGGPGCVLTNIPPTHTLPAGFPPTPTQRPHMAAGEATG